jgi:hypothetical protein
MPGIPDKKMQETVVFWVVHLLVRWVLTNVLEESAASVFTVEVSQVGKPIHYISDDG